ncbi:MAG: carboxy terminal-processing peptidase [Microscillaceae bacterium]|jgi:carboxyl-terminal processing protease|nr:carboxy terminal-processing peptidase [Microscillaceae bacterium]
MQKKLLSIVLLWVGISLGNFLSAQPELNNRSEVDKLKMLLDQYHVSPRPFDDQLSKDIFKQFIQLLDHTHKFFTQADLNQFKKYELLLDDELNGSPSGILTAVAPIYKQRLQNAQKLIEQFTAKPFNYEISTTLTPPSSKVWEFLPDEKALSDLWEKILKYRTLGLIFNKIGDKNLQNLTQDKVLANENDLRQKVKLMENRKIKRILEHPEGFEKYVASRFLLAITLSFDPHSAYMTLTQAQNFNAGLATESLSFGIDLSENEEGEIEIDRIVPGGSAWRSNELHKGDRILKLKWENQPEIDLTAAEADEVEDILEQTNQGKLEIWVRKINGTQKKVQLVKTKVREDENIVKSFVINGNPKIGYISLPGFYDEVEGSDGVGCATDVAREIIKMKKEGVQGIILDLRNNGGGSLHEGINLAGIFINEGPLVVSLTKGEKPSVLKDLNRGTVYDGPLVLLTNRQSASASEVLAAALQDYKRAIIVGSQTFGKATGQRIFPISGESNSAIPSTARERSFAKITTLKLYRVTGKTAQLKGVEPDIYIPDVFDGLDFGEREMPQALASDSIAKKVYFTPLPEPPIPELRQKSAARLQNNAYFKQMKQITQSLENLDKQRESGVPLHWKNFGEWYGNYQKVWQELRSGLEANPANLTIDNLTADKALLNMDKYGKEINDRMLQNLKTDNQLAESYQVLKDWLEK